MNIKYVDAHCHIQFEQYAEDDAALIDRMRVEGVAGVVVGVDKKSSKEAIILTKEHEHLFASVGLHPNRVADEPFDADVFRELANNSKVVAIGECGLDYFRPAEVNDDVKNKQKKVLREHIALAVELDKPLIIHARPSKGTKHPVGYPDAGDAYHDLIEILKETKAEHGEAVCGDVHFFVGGIKEAEALIKLGFTISFTAVITFTRDYDEVIRSVPIESILSETDAPYVAPVSRRGERNDPLAVIDVVSKIAEIRNEPIETVRAALLANASRIFSLN
ncbi:MAG: TatD family hydrolase [bacterium]|nr:TatD family hydrolase [bacterium]